MKVSIILPIHNQEDHIAQIVGIYRKSAQVLSCEVEIICVVNGSNDDSYKRLLKLTSKRPEFRIYNTTERGWGRSVQFGLQKATGDFVCYTNSSRTDLKHIELICTTAFKNPRAVIKAQRYKRESIVRNLGSFLFNLENTVLHRSLFSDINGTPKVLARKIYKTLSIESDGDLFDLELLVQCRKKGIPIIEVPIVSQKRFGGKSTTNLRSAIRLYIDSVQFWIKNI